MITQVYIQKLKAMLMLERSGYPVRPVETRK